MKFAKRDLKLLLILAGLLVFLLLYMLVYKPSQARIDEVESQNSVLAAQVADLEAKYMRMGEYETGIVASRKNVDDFPKYFPGDVKEEDILSYLLTMEARQGIRIESVTFNSPELVQEFSAMIEKDGKDVPVQTSAYRASTVMTGSLNYPQAKSVIDYLYATAKQTTLENVTLTYNAESGQLTGTFQLAKYYVNWDGAEYVSERVPAVDIGVGDLFGTT